MHVGKQVAGRDINNYEIDPRPDPELRRQVQEIEVLVRQAVESGAVAGSEAADLNSAAREVNAAAAHPEHGPSRLVRALTGLKHLSGAAASTAGIAEAADSIIHLVAGQ
jgi:hypothetical protein